VAQHKITGQSFDAQIARLLANPDSQCYKVLHDGASKDSELDNAVGNTPPAKESKTSSK
jgi:hypothetical protein